MYVYCCVLLKDFFTFRIEGKVLFSCSVDGVVVLWSSSNQPYDSVIVSMRHMLHVHTYTCKGDLHPHVHMLHDLQGLSSPLFHES